MRIEIYRKEQKKWVYEAYEVEDEVEFTTLNMRFSIENAYEDVIFDRDETSKYGYLLILACIWIQCVKSFALLRMTSNDQATS